MRDKFQHHERSLESPGDRHTAVVPSDTLPVDPTPRALWCQTAGNVVIEDRDGTILTYTVAAGQILPFRPFRIRATGTTATIYGWD